MIEQEELNQFETRWKQIEDSGFNEMLAYAKNPLAAKSFSIDLSNYLSLYTLVYDILMSKNQSIRTLCYERLCTNLKTHCQEVYTELQQTNSVKDFTTKWRIYKEIILKWVLKVFNYLSRLKILIQKTSSLENELISIFKTEIYDKMAAQLKQDFLCLIETYRKNEMKSPELENMKMFMTFLSKCENKEEQEFLTQITKTTEEYYTELSNKTISQSFLQYLLFGLKVLDTEIMNLTQLLPSPTYTDIITSITNIVFISKAKQLLYLQDGFYDLLDKQNYDILLRTFQIFSKDPQTLNMLLSIFKSFITEKFNLLIQKLELNTPSGKALSPQHIALTTSFLKEYSSFQSFILNLITKSFNNNNLFNVVFKEVLEDIQSNQNNINTSYLLPYYFNAILIASSSGNETDITREIDEAIEMFPYLSDKDIFITLHRNLLCDRILNKVCYSMDIEKYLLKKLEEQCGNEYIQNIDTMINDYYANEVINKKYQEYLINNNISATPNTFTVLTGERWPSSINIHKINLPNEISQLTNHIFKYYHNEFEGRTLQWSLTHSMLELETHATLFGNRSYTIICNTFQGSILLLFNSKQLRISKEDIQHALGFEDKTDCDEALTQLVKSNLLLSEDNDVFCINNQFSSDNEVIHIDKPVGKEEVVRKGKIDEDRTMAIDCHIANIMKHKKQMEHNELIEAVLNRLDKFKVKVSVIKNRIESLITKELIKRDVDNPNIYLYC